MRSSKLILAWLAVTIAASLAAMLDGGWLAGWLALEPRKIWHGEIWRLVTWVVVELGPTGLVITCLAIFRLASELVGRWGARRLMRFALAVIAGCAISYMLLALATGDATLWRCGGMVVGCSLVIAWARQFPNHTYTLWGVFVLRGQQIVIGACIYALVLAQRKGLVEGSPELVACAIAAMFPIDQRGTSTT